MPDDSTFLTQVLLPGVGGLDLKRTIDQISPQRLARMTNLVRNEEGALTGRPGLTLTATTIGGNCHSLGRLNAPGVASTRLAGVGPELYGGFSGALTLIEGDFSGNPLTMVNAHPPISGETWCYIGDSAKMRKVRGPDLLDLPIGLVPPNPTGAGYTTLATVLRTTIDSCDTAGWTNNAGTGSAAPSNAADTVIKQEGTASLRLTTSGGAAAYYNFWAKAQIMDLNRLNPGAVLASDDDIIHVWLRCDQPAKVLEVRLYFVCDIGFNANVLPGADANNNLNAYVKVWRPSDFTPIFEATASTTPTSATANSTFNTLEQLPVQDDSRGGTVELRLQQTDRARSASEELGGGRGTWTEFGVTGVPLHRRDFRRIGNDISRDWGGVTGMVVAVQVSDATSGINIWFDDIYLTGGAGLDSSLIGMTAYDYRNINYDPRTGAKSNPSPTQETQYRLDALRRGITIAPQPYGDSAIRQRFFRRGGSLSNNWYFVGENTSDGGLFTDTASDIQALGSATVAGGLLELDNDQPCTTVNSTGDTVLAQPLPAIWGPVNDILLGCGDPYRAGTLYWCKPLEYDSWPSANNQEVCSPSEELMAGLVFGGTAFVFSRERLYQAYPNLANATTVTVLPTECTHGLINRWAFTVGAGAIWFVAKDGIYATTGGKEQSLSDDTIFGLFHGESRNGYLPINLALDGKIRLEIHENDLWFLYQDTGGDQRILIYSTIFQFWQAYNFSISISSMYSEKEGSTSSLILGGLLTGSIYTHSGTTDAGTAIPGNLRTGALDQGLPRQNKLYGDIILDTKGSDLLTITPFINTEASALAAQTVTPSGTRNRFYVAVPQGQLARNLSIDLSWSASGASPTVYLLGPSYTPQPDTVETRVTNWSSQGKFTDKYVKGVVIEADTLGAAKVINIQVDGSTLTSITVSCSGRQIQQFSFPQVQGRMLRLAPADTTQWTLYSFQWIFDNEPLSIARWETQLTDNDVPEYQTLTYGYMTLRSTAIVTLRIDTYSQTGALISKTYSIPPTPTKGKQFVPFEATKGVLFKYTFTSSSPFWLYREESTVFTVPWGGDGREVKPFGDDDTDTTRGQVAPTQTSP